MADASLDDLRDRWKYLYATELPRMAKARDPAQSEWPVYLDHCFARIILDNAVGIDQPWTGVVKQPAVKHLDHDQFTQAIKLADEVIQGTTSLNELNDRSLKLRNKKRGPEEDIKRASPAKKAKSGSVISSYFLPSPSSPISRSGAEQMRTDEAGTEAGTKDTANLRTEEDMVAELRKIAESDLTSFRKQTLSLLCQVPRGRYSTYQAMSDYITQTSHKTCARAVGNAMRNNPFAPEVPCHRILAADGTLGGFGGHWGESGKFASKKHQILHDEGVRFDSRGKVKGPPFREFQELVG